MKKILIIAALAVAAFGVKAQVTNNDPITATPPAFVQTVAAYFTSANTNLASTFAVTGPTTNRGSLWTGAALQNNLNIGQEIGASYNIGKGFSAEAMALNLGVLNSIEGAELGVGYNILPLVDTKLTIALSGGARFSPKSGFIAGSIMLEKALTTHTFAGLRLEIQSGGVNDLVPEVTALTGFTF